MINLTQYENYFTGLVEKVPGVKMLKFVTSESEMTDWLADVKTDQQPFLMILIPSAKSTGSSQDDVEEYNMGLIYLLKKTDKGQADGKPFPIQKALQPILEGIKRQMLEDKGQCSVMYGLDVDSFHTDPENTLSSRTAGWSLSFTFKSSDFVTAEYRGDVLAF